MAIFVKILIFSKIMVKIGGSVETEISARWAKKIFFFNLQIYILSPPKYCAYAINAQGDMKARRIWSFMVTTFFFFLCVFGEVYYENKLSFGRSCRMFFFVIFCAVKEFLGKSKNAVHKYSFSFQQLEGLVVNFA